MTLPRHPPLDFSLFGLSGWSGGRWVEFLEGEGGRPIWSVTLAHRSEDHALVLVKSAPRERWDRLMAGGVLPGPTEFASSLVAALIDMARPEIDGSERDRYNQAIWPFAQARAKLAKSWDQVRWELDDHTVAAQMSRFAHAWTGFTLGIPGHYVGVTAFNLEGTRIDLAQVASADYGLDLAVPFLIDELEVQVRERPNTFEIVRSKSRLHDHDEVLASQGPLSN